MRIKKILYFSLNKETRQLFSKYTRIKRMRYKHSFLLLNEEDEYEHASELLIKLQQLEHIQEIGYYHDVFVIIDYLSMMSPKSDDISDSSSNAANFIRTAIIKYPEVFFLFDESGADSKFSFVDFLFDFNSVYTKDVSIKAHQFSVINKATKNEDLGKENNQNNLYDPFAFLSLGRDNLFDWTRLRYSIKHFYYDRLKVKIQNFSLIQNSRYENLALCIEEEKTQNRLNSYSLYVSGFRVRPILSSKELLIVNSECPEEKNAWYPKLIVRDFDLQFPDIIDEMSITYTINNNNYIVNQIDLIRGAKFWEESDKNPPPSEYKNKWFIPKGDNGYDYWGKLNNITTYFVSKGAKRVVFCKTKSKILKKFPMTIFQGKLYVRGILKPVSGIYFPFHYFEEIKDRYESFEIRDKSSFVLREASIILNNCSKEDNKFTNRKEQTMKFLIDRYQIKKYHLIYWRLWLFLKKRCSGILANTSLDKSIWKDEAKKQAWFIDTSRDKHDHGVPLDVYDLAQSMLSRAEIFYNNGKYILSAVISSETIELLNGFHESLTLRAYYILAISENAIAINTTGGSEFELIEDTKFRINKIQKEIDRILERLIFEGEVERRELKHNILNQIYSECRQYCREKDFFGPENCFISAIAHVKEGF